MLLVVPAKKKKAIQERRFVDTANSKNVFIHEYGIIR